MITDKFFEKYPNIDREEFLKSIPITLNVSLEEAIPFYVARMKFLETKDPDDEHILTRTEKAIQFVFDFCKENDLTVKDYLSYCPQSMPCWVEHLKNHKINFYTLHVLTLSKPDVESELLEFVIPNFYLTFQKTKNKYYHSKIAKEKFKQMLNKNVRSD